MSIVCVVFCFLKQKTAYAKRMRDCSSDVDSSDLPVPGSRQAWRHDRFLPVADPQRQGSEAVLGQGPARPEALGKACHAQYRQSAELWCSDHRIEARRKAGPGDGPPAGEVSRSEEHTSELQSLMRNSYAVFCLKKKKHNRRQHNTSLSSHK